MDTYYCTKYQHLTDQQIVEKVLATPHDEEAAYYFLHERYKGLMYSVYTYALQDLHITNTRGETWLEDCIDELFMHLKGKDMSWHPLATFEWRCPLRSWLVGVAMHKFKKVIPRMVENYGDNLSIDKDSPDAPKVQLPDGAEKESKRLQDKLLLLEAVGLLKNDDQRFVILKRLEGYNSKEIALLLQKKWQKHGIKKYNSKKELVVPTATYVDGCTQHAKNSLRNIIKDIN